MSSQVLPTTTFRCCRAAAAATARTQKRNLSSSQRLLLRPSSSATHQPRRKNGVVYAATPAQSRRWQSTDAAAAEAAAPLNPKIAGIVDQISQLTLLETADLVASLKVRFFLEGGQHTSTLRPPFFSSPFSSCPVWTGILTAVLST